jgi:hypothetical protein
MVKISCISRISHKTWRAPRESDCRRSVIIRASTSCGKKCVECFWQTRVNFIVLQFDNQKSGDFRFALGEFKQLSVVYNLEQPHVF